VITDDPKEMKLRLTEYVNSASLALETLATLDPSDFDLSKRPEPDTEYEQYIQALHNLNHARTWLGIATEQLHDLLNQYNDSLIEAAQEQRKQEYPGYPAEIPTWIRKGDDRLKKRVVTLAESGEVVRGKITAILKYSDGAERIEIRSGTPRTGTTTVWADPADVELVEERLPDDIGTGRV